MAERLGRFLEVSARLTGFGVEELRATGMAEEYATLAADRLGAGGYRQLLDADPADQAVLGEAERAVAQLWYTGGWDGPGGPRGVVSARAYAAGLVWRAIGTRAPGTGGGGFGDWAAR